MGDTIMILILLFIFFLIFFDVYKIRRNSEILIEQNKELIKHLKREREN
ncbi:hypothetical protein KYI10_11400 (plasmid) [Macrococcus psychrotolerans]|uniref:Small hydrophobic protein n=1 Tax=Macrococcus psychrotolerans TaxID=3039389 RepID=A0AAT9P9T1_9STAP|nr:hypothetical protein [Macrococcus sp. 19Msa1099]QYA34003.1 hypothetical protein KYI10_11400 [Macrococcus sp. 19Msa1099]